MLARGILHDFICFHATFIVFGRLTCTGDLLVYYERTRRQSENLPHPVARTRTASVVSPASLSVQDGLVDIDRRTRWRMVVASLSTFSNFLASALVSATLDSLLRSHFGASLTVGT
jgi:hypothetical protein